MPQAVYILFGTAFTVAVSLAAGRLLLRGLSINQVLGLTTEGRDGSPDAAANGAAAAWPPEAAPPAEESSS